MGCPDSPFSKPSPLSNLASAFAVYLLSYLFRVSIVARIPEGILSKIANTQAARYKQLMKTTNHPLSLDEDLDVEVKTTAQAAGLSQAETVRRAMTAGLSKMKSEARRSRPTHSLFESLRALGPVKLKGR